MTERRKRRIGTVVQSLKAEAGSSELAILAAATPPHKAVAAIATFSLDGQTTMFVCC